MIACVPFIRIIRISVCHSFRLDWKVMFPKGLAGLVGLKDMILMKFIYKSNSVLRCFNGQKIQPFVHGSSPHLHHLHHLQGGEIDVHRLVWSQDQNTTENLSHQL